jgi:hypothetical protein
MLKLPEVLFLPLVRTDNRNLVRREAGGQQIVDRAIG